MDRVDDQWLACVLAQIEWHLGKMSETQRELARRKARLREHAARLRLGARVAQIHLPIQAMLTS